VDNLGLRKGEPAMAELDRLLKEEEPLRLLGMIVRQYRLLLMVKELMARGTTPRDMEKELDLRGWQLRKLQEQARRSSIAQLEEIYTRLRDTDVSIKTGRAEPRMALVLLVAELTT
jgi:DNA polymerase-3 subunit delta